MAIVLLVALFVLAPVASAHALETGFEEGSDGAVLGTPWIVFGTPQHAEYDSARSKTGSLSGWVQGPVGNSYAGVREEQSGGMSSDGAEIRFWMYLDSANQQRMIDDYAPSALTADDRAFFVHFGTDGKINTYTNRPGNPNGYTTGAYVPIGTYSTGWTEFRLVLTFSGADAQTYTLSMRQNAADPWTQLKAAGAATYAIPFRGANTITQTHGLMFRGYAGANLWLDDIQYSDAGIQD